MNTILPRFLYFNNKVAFYKVNLPTFLTGDNLILFTVIILIVMFIFWLTSILRWLHSMCTSSNNELFHKSLAIISSVFGILTILISAVLIRTELDLENDYTSHGVAIPNTNLMATPYQVEPPKDDETDNSSDIRLDPNKNYRGTNYYVYVDLINHKPSGIDSKYVINQTPVNAPFIQTIYGGWRGIGGTQVRNDNSKNIIYLGQMKNGKFIPNYKNTKIVHIFMEYQKYIIRHKLENKFKHHFNFEVSYKYFTKNNDPVLTVVGDNAFTLHYKNSKMNKDNDIAQNTK